MRASRLVGAHLAAVLSGSLVLLIGIEATVFGPVGIPQGVGKWIGGVLIFIFLAIASLPLGLVLRLVVGRLNSAPLRGAMLGGAFVGFGLMFVLHPAMYPGVSFWTDPLALSLAHTIAGVCGGAAWYWIEYAAEGEKIG